MIDLINHPAPQENSGKYRTLIVVEVLSDKPVSDWSLSEIAHEIVDGESSGCVEVKDAREISNHDMYDLLNEQGSDPEFLLGEECWRYGLHNGDEVTVSDGQTVIISEIEWENDNVARIVDKNGGRHELRFDELS